MIEKGPEAEVNFSGLLGGESIDFQVYSHLDSLPFPSLILIFTTSLLKFDLLSVQVQFSGLLLLI